MNSTAGVSVVSGATSCCSQTLWNMVFGMLDPEKNRPWRSVDQCRRARLGRGAAELDAVDDFEQGAGAGFHDVGAGAGTPETAVLVFDVNHRLALGILPFGHGADFEFTQRDRHAGGGFQGHEGRIHRAIAAGRMLDAAAVTMRQADGGLRAFRATAGSD